MPKVAAAPSEKMHWKLAQISSVWQPTIGIMQNRGRRAPPPCRLPSDRPAWPRGPSGAPSRSLSPCRARRQHVLAMSEPALHPGAPRHPCGSGHAHRPGCPGPPRQPSRWAAHAFMMNSAQPRFRWFMASEVAAITKARERTSCSKTQRSFLSTPLSAFQRVCRVIMLG